MFIERCASAWTSIIPLLTDEFWQLSLELEEALLQVKKILQPWGLWKLLFKKKTNELKCTAVKLNTMVWHFGDVMFSPDCSNILPYWIDADTDFSVAVWC